MKKTRSLWGVGATLLDSLPLRYDFRKVCMASIHASLRAHNISAKTEGRFAQPCVILNEAYYAKYG